VGRVYSRKGILCRGNFVVEITALVARGSEEAKDQIDNESAGGDCSGNGGEPDEDESGFADFGTGQRYADHEVKTAEEIG
jgi:hypothetical protein